MLGIKRMEQYRPEELWATSWYTLAATRVLRRWIEECPHKGVALNDGTCT